MGTPETTRPRGRSEAAILTGVAGVLCTIQGLSLFGASTPLPYADISVPAAAVAAALVGVTLMLVADLYRTLPEYRPRFGPLVIILAASDFWFGGGFLVGSLLGVIGGLLMIVLPVERGR
jgi:Family of unknown function (DUF6114)